MAFWSEFTTQNIFIGSNPNDGTGDPIRDAFNKVDQNFANITLFLNATSLDHVTSFQTIGASKQLIATRANIGNLLSDTTYLQGNTFILGNTHILGNTFVDGNIQFNSPLSFYGNLNVSADIIPTTSGVYNIGSPTNRFNTVYVTTYNSSSQINQYSDSGILKIHANAFIGDQQDTGILGNITSDYNGSNNYAFFGHQYTTNNFIYKITKTDATQGNSIVYDGIYGNAQFGSLFLSNTTAANNSSTGALTVAGGAGIARDLYVGGNSAVAGDATVTGNIFSSGYQVVTMNPDWMHGTPYTGGYISGNTIFVSGAPSVSTVTGAVTIPFGGLGVGGNITAGGIVGPMYGLLQTANQPNITSLGILTGLTVTGTIAANSIQATSIGVNTITVTGAINYTGSLGGLSSISTILTTANTINAATIGNTGTILVGTLSTSYQPNVTAVGTLSNLTVSGNTVINNTLYAQGIYDNSNRVVSTSAGAGNLTVVSGAINLASTGPGTGTFGSANSIPVITSDAYGRIAGITTLPVATILNITANTGASNVALLTQNLSILGNIGIRTTVSGQTLVINNTGVTGLIPGTDISLSGGLGNITVNSTSTLATVTGRGATTSSLVSLTAGGVGAGATSTLNVSGDITVARSATTGTIYLGSGGANYLYYNGSNYQFGAGGLIPSANVTYNLGTSTQWWGTLYGRAVQAVYADLAENYSADAEYEPGTVVVFGGDAEITTTNKFADVSVAGAISTDPAYLMNGAAEGLPVALRGKVPVKVVGPVYKGDLLVTAGQNPGYATSVGKSTEYPLAVFAKSIETNTADGVKVITAVIL